MPERLSFEQIESVKNLSRRFEKSWRIATGPEKYSPEEKSKAIGFLVGGRKEIAISMLQASDLEMIILLNSIYLGLFHRKIIIPLEFKLEPPNTNRKP